MKYFTKTLKILAVILICGACMYSGIIGHYLNGYKVPLKWYFGDVEDPLFLERFRITIRAQKAIRQMKHAKIALVGGIAPGFDDLYDDERNIIKLFDGIRINRLHEYGELRDLALSIDQESVAERVKLQLAEAKGINPKASGLMELNARFAIAYERFAAANGYDAIAISCWPKSTDEFKYSICAVVGELNDKGIVAACEGDLTSAISMDIASLEYKGMNLNFTSKPGLNGRNPFDTHGEEALRSIMGGLFFTCGLENICAPCTTDGKDYPMHGRMRTTPAEHELTNCCSLSIIAPITNHKLNCIKRRRNKNTKCISTQQINILNIS